MGCHRQPNRCDVSQTNKSAASTFRATARILARECFDEICPVALLSLFVSTGDVDAQGGAASGEVQGAISIGEQPVVANAHEPAGENVLEKSSDEFVDFQGHGFGATAMAIVSPCEGDTAVFQVDQAVVGDGDAMGVAREVIEDFRGAAEGRRGVNDPVNPAVFLQKTFESLGLCKSCDIAVELELSFVEGLFERLEKEPPIEARESTLTGNKKPLRQETHCSGRSPASPSFWIASPPPGTTQ